MTAVLLTVPCGFCNEAIIIIISSSSSISIITEVRDFVKIGFEKTLNYNTC
jgi:hypothetical protein